MVKNYKICQPKILTHLPAQEKRYVVQLNSAHIKMFPKHKIDHKNIVNMDTTVNHTKGIIKEALFVGCLDPTE